MRRIPRGKGRRSNSETMKNSPVAHTVTGLFCCEIDSLKFCRSGTPPVKRCAAICFNLCDIRDNTQLRVSQKFQHPTESYFVVVQRRLGFVIVFAGAFMGDRATGDADTLAQALGKHLAFRHIKELIFQRRATGVNNQNFHH